MMLQGSHRLDNLSLERVTCICSPSTGAEADRTSFAYNPIYNVSSSWRPSVHWLFNLPQVLHHPASFITGPQDVKHRVSSPLTSRPDRQPPLSFHLTMYSAALCLNQLPNQPVLDMMVDHFVMALSAPAVLTVVFAAWLTSLVLVSRRLPSVWFLAAESAEIVALSLVYALNTRRLGPESVDALGIVGSLGFHVVLLWTTRPYSSVSLAGVKAWIMDPFGRLLSARNVSLTTAIADMKQIFMNLLAQPCRVAAHFQHLVDVLHDMAKKTEEEWKKIALKKLLREARSANGELGSALAARIKEQQELADVDALNAKIMLELEEQQSVAAGQLAEVHARADNVRERLRVGRLLHDVRHQLDAIAEHRAHLAASNTFDHTQRAEKLREWTRREDLSNASLRRHLLSIIKARDDTIDKLKAELAVHHAEAKQTVSVVEHKAARAEDRREDRRNSCLTILPAEYDDKRALLRTSLADLSLINSSSYDLVAVPDLVPDVSSGSSSLSDSAVVTSPPPATRPTSGVASGSPRARLPSTMVPDLSQSVFTATPLKSVAGTKRPASPEVAFSLTEEDVPSPKRAKVDPYGCMLVHMN